MGDQGSKSEQIFINICFVCMSRANLQGDCKQLVNVIPIAKYKKLMETYLSTGVIPNELKKTGKPLPNMCNIEIVHKFNKNDLETKCKEYCKDAGQAGVDYINKYISENAPINALLEKVDHSLVSECFLGNDTKKVNVACDKIVDYCKKNSCTKLYENAQNSSGL